MEPDECAVSGGQQEEILKKIEAALEQMLVGKASAPIAATAADLRLDRIVELTNMLSGNFEEMALFSRALSAGNLDIEAPGRRNYLAAPLKALHSLLSSFSWTANQLAQGRVVERMDYMGELSDALNSLIDRVAQQNTEGDSSAGEIPADSWRYHQFLAAFNHLPQMVLITDDEGNMLFSNQPAIRRFGKHSHLRDSQNVLEQTLCSHSSGENTFPLYGELRDEDNIWYKITSDLIVLPRGAGAYLHCVEDISEWKRSEIELKISATTDALTGVYNRDMGVKRLETAIMGRESLPTCAAFIDIDRLKYINDNFGHNEGDYAIRTISEALASTVRDTDIVSRFGGDEFLVIFSGCPMEAAEKILNRVYEKIRLINESGVKPYPLSFSYGVTRIDASSNDTVRDMIQLMDKKMYERKKAKRS